MTAPQIEIKRGIAFQFVLDVSSYSLPSGVTFKAALVNPSTNMRYESNAPTGSGELTFVWPSGLTQAGAVDNTCTNGTAQMTIGTYNLEVYTSDFSDMGTLYERFRVVDSNLMAQEITTTQTA